MVLDFEYGINIGNRFGDLVDHDEDPDEFIANQTQAETKSKKLTTTKDTKSASASGSTKKTTSKTATSTSAANVSSSTTKTNKENLTGKSTNADQRKQQSNVLGDNNNNNMAPQTRGDSARGGGRMFSRRGVGSAGQDRPAYEGGNRGGGQQRSHRYNKFEGQQASNETGSFEQGGDAWGTEPGNENQTFGGYRGRGGRGGGGGGRGNYSNRNFEGGRGGGRGRGGRGRGNYSNRNFDEGTQQHQQTQETGGWQESTESNFDNTPAQSVQTGGAELDASGTPQERPIEPDTSRRGGRGSFRPRTFRSQRDYGRDRYENEGGHDDNRQYRRQHDRQPRSYVSGVKPIEKKDGEGAHNWGNPLENPDEQPAVDETNETEAAQTAPTQKAWAEQVDEAEKAEEAEKQMTLDEYKKKLEEKRRAQLEKQPQFNRRVAGEGEDPKNWQNFQHEYRKKNDDGESEEEDEEGMEDEEHESEGDAEEEHATGKKRIINIPLHFKPIHTPRGGPMGSRGGPRRGGSGIGRNRDRPYRDDQPRPKSPSQQQTPSSQQTGEYQYEEQQQEQQQRPYRGGGGGGPRGQGYGRSEYRRSYSNSARGSRGGHNRSQAEMNTPDLGNTKDFPTLHKP